MKNKIIAAFLVSAITASSFTFNGVNVGMTCDAAANPTEPVYDTQSVGLIASYTLGCTAGNKKIYIDSSTNGNKKLAKIGVRNIKVQRSSDKKNWTTEKTPSNQLFEDAYSHHLTDYTVTVSGGYYYRVVLEHYAKEDTWWFPKEETIGDTSNVVWVS